MKSLQHLHPTGLRLTTILSAPLFRAEFGAGNPGARSLPGAFHGLWTDFADALAALPVPADIALVLAAPSGPDPRETRSCEVSLLVFGRGRDQAAAERSAQSALRSIRVLAETILGFARFREMTPDEVESVMAVTRGPAVVEVRRRRETFGVISEPSGEPVGFLFPGGVPEVISPPAVSHLFPWVPSDDSWARLAQVLMVAEGPSALVVRARGFHMAPAEAVAKAYAGTRTIETAELLVRRGSEQPFLLNQLEALHRLGSDRLATFYHRVLALRVFLVGQAEPSPALLATLAGSIDDPSASVEAVHARNPFRGGLTTRTASPAEVLEPLDEPDPDILFSPSEATAVLRTPMPTDAEIRGIPLMEARSLLLGGESGDEVPLGSNVHGGSCTTVRFTEELRFRHTYVIGQTGTGKSTLLLNMLLADAALGRGICLLDPHGSLVDEVLERLPRERHDDVVLLDLVDHEAPVGFNPLAIQEDDPDRYVRERDLVIEGLLAYLQKTYAGVPEAFGPVFETHFRTMLALLLGVERPKGAEVPNFLLMRRFYSRKVMRDTLIARNAGQDFSLKDTIDEAMRVTEENSWSNVAPYITSKFSRFVVDTTLRNIICQRTSIDFAQIVRERRILLVHLGRGRIGEFSAGLLAGQILARIQRAVMGRGTDPSQPAFYFYADEFQIFADSRFAEMLADARKFRLSLTLAHQHMDQLPADVRSAVLGNCGTVVSFRVGAGDANVLSSLFHPFLSPNELIGLPNHNAYVRSSGTFGLRPFSVMTSPAPRPADPSQAAAIRAASSARYGRSKAAVEEEIAETLAVYDAMRVSDRPTTDA